jgi:tetratricopeptide (TPR) repeat protein
MCRYQQKRFDYAANYIRGELTEVEAEAFEAHYLTCEECFSAIRFVEKTAVTMNHFGASIFAPASANSAHAFAPLGWPEKVKNWWNDFVSSIEWKTAAPSFAVYVLLVAALSIGYYWIFSSPPMAYHKLPSHVDRPSAMLPEPSKIADLPQLQPLAWSISEATKANAMLFPRLNEVQPLYENYNHFLAAERLAKLSTISRNQLRRTLYLGVSQLRLTQPAEAIASFRKVLELNPEHAAARWYLAQGYLMQNNVTEAQSLLATLAKNQDSQYGQPAVQLLKDIDKIQSQHK